jgi:SAM-dependent methyltransferase
MLEYVKRIAKPFVPAAVRAWHRQRVQARRSNEEIFSSIYREKAWGAPGLDYCSGNIPVVIEGYVAGVRDYLSAQAPATIVDIGCGDFEAGRRLTDLAHSYIACDVVPALVERNRRKFQYPNVTFVVLDATLDPLPQGDIVIVKQVFQHLRNDQIATIVRKLRPFKTWIISEHTPTGPFEPNRDMNTDSSVRGHDPSINSGVVLTEPPFSIKPRTTKLLAEVPAHEGIIRTFAYKF